MSVIGALTQAQVPDLLQACAAPHGVRVVVDLTNLVSTDGIGLRTLRRIRAQGAQLKNTPRYIESLPDD